MTAEVVLKVDELDEECAGHLTVLLLESEGTIDGVRYEMYGRKGL
jgi:hypothetical protein